MTDNHDFALFIDELRKSRKISRENFADGVISLRQYYRFIRGESSLKSETVNSLLDKLEINTLEAYETHLRRRNEAYEKLCYVYDMCYNDNYEEAYKLFSVLDYDTITSEYNKKYYKFLETIIYVYSKRISRLMGINKIKELIKYPDVLEKKVLSFIEISALTYISDFLVKNEDYRIPNYTYNLIHDEENKNFKEISSQSFPFYLTTAKCLGKIGDVEKSLEVANKGINLYHMQNSFNTLINLYYIRALSEKKLFSTTYYKKTLCKIFALMYAHNNTTFVNEVKRVIYKNFGIKENDLIEFK